MRTIESATNTRVNLSLPDAPAQEPMPPLAASAAPERAATADSEGEIQQPHLNVLVLGMHRAGTSAVAGILELAGVSPGVEHIGQAPNFDNPRGYHERLDVVSFNDRMLAALGWHWDTPPAAPLSQTPPLTSLIDEGRALVKTSLGDGPWFVKDPRMSLLLPWWRQILVDRFLAVVPVRPAIEVAWSLHVRNGLPMALGLAIWRAYNRHLAAGLNGLPVVAVRYAELTEDPRHVTPLLVSSVERLAAMGNLAGDVAATGIHRVLRRDTQPVWSEQSLTSLEETTAQERLWARDPVTVHERFDIDPGNADPVDEALLETHRQRRTRETELAVAEAAARAAREQASQAAAAAQSSARETAAIAARLSRAEADDAAAQQTIAANEVALRGRLEELSAVQADRASLLEAEAQHETQVHGLRARIAELQADLANLEMERAAELEGLRSRIASLESSLADAEAAAQQAIRANEATLADLTAELSVAQADRAGLLVEQAEHQAQLEGLRSSVAGLQAELTRAELQRAAELETLRSAISDLESRRATAAVEHAREVERLKVTIATFERNEAGSQAMVQSVVSGLQAEYAALQTTYTTEKRVAETSITEVETRLRLADGERRQLETRLRLADGERRQLETRLRLVGEESQQLEAGLVATIAGLQDQLTAVEIERDQRVGGLESTLLRLEQRFDQSVLAAIGGTHPTAGRWDGFLRRHRVLASWLIRPIRFAWAIVTLQKPRFLRGSPLFDWDWYRDRYADVGSSRLRARWHYWRRGVAEGRDPNPYFDSDWYLARYQDVRESGINPLDHYHRNGWTEGRDPSPRFSTVGYLRNNPDVLAIGMDPLLHYLRYGIGEGRVIEGVPGAPTSPEPAAGQP